jgi:sugar lactone lactonase YvrE
MRKLAVVLGIAFITLLVLQGASTFYVLGFFKMGNQPLSPGSVETLFLFEEGDHPEGIALDSRGNIYVGNRHPENGGLLPLIIKIEPNGTHSEYARLPLTTNPGAEGLLGLVVEASGDLYAALVSMDENHGVWKIGRDGTAKHLSGSEQMIFPNALTFDNRGNLFATDSFGGSVWRFDKNGQAELWVQHAELEPGANPLGMVLPGANGIDFFPPNILYVANTSQGTVVRITINPDGSPGGVEVVANDPWKLFTIDGIAVDVHGNIYAVLPGYLVIENSPVVKIDPKTGQFTALVTDPQAVAQFDIPLSLAFGSGARDKQSVYVTNGALEFDFIPPGAGPGVVQVGVGAPGYRGR